MKSVALCCPAIHEKIDVTYGLRKLSKYARRELAGADLDIHIVPLAVAEETEVAADRLLDRSPDLVGLSTFIWNVRDNLRLARRIKERSPATRVIFGGPQVSDPDWNLLEHTREVDAVVRGEGEATFTDLLRLWLATGRVAGPEVDGLSYRGEDGRTLHNPDRPHIEPLDRIPHIYDGFETQPGVLYGLETTRGCYLRCGYCSMGLMPFRRHSPEYVLEELDAMAAAGVGILNILDSSFTFHKKRNIPLARRLGELGMRYICCGKAEEMDSEMIDVLIDSGVLKIEFGLQATHPETLRLMGRRMNKERFEAAVREFLDKARGTDIEVTIDIIAGLPGDSLETFLETLDFAYSLRPTQVSAFPLQLLPATEFFHRAEELGIRRLPITEPILRDKGRYNLHRYGLVTETVTFSATEIERAREICLLNALVLQAHMTPLVYRILDAESRSFSSWLLDFAKLLPEGTYGRLERMDADPAVRQEVWTEVRRALVTYARDTSSPAVHATIAERFPEARATA